MTVAVQTPPETVVACIWKVWIVTLFWIVVLAARTAAAIATDIIAIGISGRPWNDSLTRLRIFMIGLTRGCECNGRRFVSVWWSINGLVVCKKVAFHHGLQFNDKLVGFKPFEALVQGPN